MFAALPSIAGAEIRIVNPQPRVRPGGFLLLRVSVESRIRVFERDFAPNENGLVFVGVDLAVPIGTYPVTEIGPNNEAVDSKDFEVVPANVGVRRSAPGTVTARRRRELNLINQAYARVNGTAWYPSSDFVEPLEDTVTTSEFAIGHRGVDLRARTGTDVLSINAGHVLMVARNFSLEGNMVIIDHGSGVLSLYMHLSQLSVKEGQPVEEAGQVIGRSGVTGRVRGPHLHFAVKMNGVNIEPLAFIKMFNCIYPLAGQSR